MKQSAGILLYKKTTKGIEILLVHPGGPFWAKKDHGAWSLPKGEFDNSEPPLDAAKREFKEETSQDPPTGSYQELGDAKQKSGKVVFAWAIEGDFDLNQFESDTFEMEWPPKSGKTQEFPENDKAAWFSLAVAKQKIVPGQAIFIDRLADLLNVDISVDDPPTQATLF